MEPKPNQSPLIVIVGETASGKSALAIDLAKQFGGEIIAADSRTVYKGMDIGTAKPTRMQQTEVRHHLIDISTPDKPITAADFKRLAQEAIREISSRGKIPFLVGGTGLYIDAVLYDYSFSPKGNDATRQRWQQFSVEELQAELHKRDIALPENDKNPRYLIRQLETGGIVPEVKKLRANTLVIGLSVDRSDLKERIEQRIEQMVADGLEKEVQGLQRTYSWDIPPMQTIGYQEFRPDGLGVQSVEATKATIRQNTAQYAKRQRTWFKRNKSIHWTWE